MMFTCIAPGCTDSTRGLRGVEINPSVNGMDLTDPRLKRAEQDQIMGTNAARLLKIKS